MKLRCYTAQRWYMKSKKSRVKHRHTQTQKLRTIYWKNSLQNLYFSRGTKNKSQTKFSIYSSSYYHSPLLFITFQDKHRERFISKNIKLLLSFSTLREDWIGCETYYVNNMHRHYYPMLPTISIQPPHVPGRFISRFPNILQL